MPDVLPPDTVAGTSDPGDDVQRRFRYQATYAAILSVALLDHDTDFEELFCEQHEDVLVKHNSGFTGVQIKTRETGLGPFKSSDGVILKALARFVTLDGAFPGHFKRFVIVSNCGFWRDDKNSSNLQHVIALAAQHRGNTQPLKELRTVLKQLLKALDVQQSALLEVLQKLQLQDGAGLEDIELRLINKLGASPDLGDLSYPDLRNVAKSLTSLALEAAALSHDSPIRDYLSLLADPQQSTVHVVIGKKRITPSMVKSIVEAAKKAPCVIRSRNTIPIEMLPKGFDKMRLKMGSGGISAVNIQLAEDHKYSMEHMLSQWLFKHGGQRTQAQFDQLATIVNTECQASRDSVSRTNAPYGIEMLADVRRRIAARRDLDPMLMFDCTFEHLLGIAGILTEQCKLWWSDTFEIAGA